MEEDRINWDSPKFAEEDRTFETRVQFIHDIFSNKFTSDEILGRCIQHKLKESYENYLMEMHKSLWNLDGADPIAVIKRIDK